jgi:hypothetical protein
VAWLVSTIVTQEPPMQSASQSTVNGS